MKQEMVANYIGINRVELSYYENGTRKQPLDVLNKLADLYGVELIEILEENPKLSKVNAALSFRSEDVNENDLQVIAEFRKIIKNYLKMKTIEKA